MELIVAESAGFCMGVRRAIEMAEAVARDEGRTVYTHGPLIHNPQALDNLKGKGVEPLPADGPIPRAAVIVRAHGVPPGDFENLKNAAERVVDATCPKVSTIQKKIADYSGRGYAVVIAGDDHHPEVVGLLGHAKNQTFVVRGPAAVADLPDLDRVLLVSQTTQDEEVFEAIRKQVIARYPRAETLSTICSSTHRRQAETREIASRVDAMVVIGGRNSANTCRLAEICTGLGTPAHHVETAAELDLADLARLDRVGVTAGASTPVWIIHEVVEALKTL